MVTFNLLPLWNSPLASRIATIALVVFVGWILAASALSGAEEAPAREPLFTDSEWEQGGDRSLIGRSGDNRSAAPESGQVAGSVARMLVGLVVVVGIAVLIAWIMRRSGLHRRFPGQRGEHLEVLEHISLGPKRAVSLLRVGSHYVVVGHNDAMVAALASFDQLKETAAPDPLPTLSPDGAHGVAVQEPLAAVDHGPQAQIMEAAPPLSAAAGAGTAAPVDEFRQRLSRLLGRNQR